jgi:acyl transferase domain-containing protein
MANPLVVSSIKGNVGHCEAASGAAGLAKLLLMLRNKEVPSQAGLNQLNPGLGDLDAAGIVIPSRSRSWVQTSAQPRRALLNNFGAAGSNAALLLEEMLETEEGEQDLDDRSAYVFNLSAKSKDALKASISQHRQFFEQMSPQLPLRDICYTASARRQAYNHRISIACASMDDLRTKLEKVDLTTLKPAESSRGMVFVFSGQGSLYPGMGKELMDTSPSFRKSILQCDNIIQGLGFPSILNFLRNDKTVSRLPQPDDQIIVSQCACVSLEYALAKLMMSWKIVPDLLIGHRYLPPSLLSSPCLS